MFQLGLQGFSGVLRGGREGLVVFNGFQWCLMRKGEVTVFFKVVSGFFTGF